MNKIQLLIVSMVILGSTCNHAQHKGLGIHVPVMQPMFTFAQPKPATALETHMISDVIYNVLTKEKLKKYLGDKNFNINAQIPSGTEPEFTVTALMQAIRYDNKAIAELLLKQGADVNTPNNQGTTALHFAVSLQKLPLVTLLLAYGANPNSQDEYGFTPFSIAIDYVLASEQSEQNEILKTLLKTKKINFELPNQLGYTPLLEAAFKHNISVFRLLVKQGAQVDAQDAYGWTGLMKAAQKQDEIATFIFLAGGASPFLQSYDKATIAEKLKKTDPEYAFMSEKEREEKVETLANKTFFSVAGELVHQPPIQKALIWLGE